MRRPAFQFYPADWRKDIGLQSCSIAARGLWLEMLCIAHECEPYGHLAVNGSAMTAAQIGRHTGLSESECAPLIAELEAAGVFSRTEGGAIFSRRMVADEAVRSHRADGGHLGAEHGAKGASHGKKGGAPSKARKQPPLQPPLHGSTEPPLEPPFGDAKEPPLQPPSEPPPSSSSSSSSSEYSVAKATEPASAVSPVDNSTPKKPKSDTKAEVWRAAVSTLKQGGCEDEAQARTFMGKLAGDFGFDAVREAVAAAVSEQPADAREYLKATCLRIKGARLEPVTVPSNAAEKTREYLEAQRMTPEQEDAARKAREAVAERLRAVRNETLLAGAKA